MATDRPEGALLLSERARSEFLASVLIDLRVAGRLLGKRGSFFCMDLNLSNVKKLVNRFKGV